MNQLLSLIPVKIALAQDVLDISPTNGFAPLGNITVTGIIQTALTVILILAGLVFFFMLVIGGIRWILSGGDKTQTENARNQITAALIGLVIVFAAWAIARLIAYFFGDINIFRLDIPKIPQSAPQV